MDGRAWRRFTRCAAVGAIREPDGQGAVVQAQGRFRLEGGSWKRTRRFGGAGNCHRTLCEFRCRHQENFKGLFVEMVGVVRGACTFRKAVGTKVCANASKRKAMSYGAQGGVALDGGGVAEHGCGRTLWGIVARERVARRVAPSRGSVDGDCCGEGACGAT